jgi:hypothetical protein
MNGKGYGSAIEIFCLSANSLLVSQLTVVWMIIDWDIMNLRADIRIPQRFENLFSLRSVLQTNTVDMPR